MGYLDADEFRVNHTGVGSIFDSFTPFGGKPVTDAKDIQKPTDLLKFHMQPKTLAMSAIPVIGPLLVGAKILEGGGSKASRTAEFRAAANQAVNQVEQGKATIIPQGRQIVAGFQKLTHKIEQTLKLAEGTESEQVTAAFSALSEPFGIADDAVSTVQELMDAIEMNMAVFEAGKQYISPNDPSNSAIKSLEDAKKNIQALAQAAAVARTQIAKVERVFNQVLAVVKKDSEDRATQKRLSTKAAQAKVSEAIKIAQDAAKQNAFPDAMAALQDEEVVAAAQTANAMRQLQSWIDWVAAQQQNYMNSQGQYSQMDQFMRMLALVKQTKTGQSSYQPAATYAQPAPVQSYGYGAGWERPANESYSEAGMFGMRGIGADFSGIDRVRTALAFQVNKVKEKLDAKDPAGASEAQAEAVAVVGTSGGLSIGVLAAVAAGLVAWSRLRRKK